MRSTNYARTDQFAVAKQLEGLQEKFQVLNRDDLADGLRARLEELNEHRSSWFPEILSLLLQLSDRPAQFSSLDKLEELKPQSPEKPLSWNDLDVSGSAYCDDGIWEDVNFTVEPSEDDVSSVFSVSSSPRIRPESSAPPDDEDYVIPDEVFSSSTDEKLITSISSVQFWKPENSATAAKQEGRSSRVITELQMLRETIFMLQGLPTSLFWRRDNTIEVDCKYTLPHASDEALSSALRVFCSIGAKIDVSRRFTSGRQTIPYMQTFHRRIEDYLHSFDMILSEIQSQYLSPKATASISILKLLDDVRRESGLLLVLSDLVSDLKGQDPDQPVQCLDMLYDLVCMTQATGDDTEFRPLAELFLSCFETYARPIRLWMERGQLDSRYGTFFVGEDRKDAGLRTLWHDWYVLAESARWMSAPKFLRPAARKMFTTGKTMVFLQHLEVLPDTIDGLKETSLSFEDLFPQALRSSLCLPFSTLLETAFDRLVDANHAVASNILRNQLDQQCGLWISLQALEHIYFCKDMSIFSTIDHTIFELIDQGGAWNDRFLLTELAQSAFNVLPFIDASGLIVRSKASPNEPDRSRSVEALQVLSFDYALPWPVANIVTKEAIGTYQRVSTFLMQMRRAKYTILKQRAQDDRAAGSRTNAHSYALRHNMLWFLNTLYCHMTDLVISTTTESMRKSLSSSTDVDDMISAHRDYMTSLKCQCLLSENLSPVHEAVINILDTCIQFADLQTSPGGLNKPTRTSKPRNPRESNEYRSAAEDLDDTDNESDCEYHTPARIPCHSFGAHTQQLKSIKDKFSNLVGVVTAGLKEVGRKDRQHSWEILAEKLEWRNKEPF